MMWMLKYQFLCSLSLILYKKWYQNKILVGKITMLIGKIKETYFHFVARVLFDTIISVYIIFWLCEEGYAYNDT